MLPRASACPAAANTAPPRSCAWSPLRSRAARRREGKSDSAPAAAGRSRLGDSERLGNAACASSAEPEPIIGKRSRILRETASGLLARAGSANARRRRLLQSPRSGSLARAGSQAAEIAIEAEAIGPLRRPGTPEDDGQPRDAVKEGWRDGSVFTWAYPSPAKSREQRDQGSAPARSERGPRTLQPSQAGGSRNRRDAAIRSPASGSTIHVSLGPSMSV